MELKNLLLNGILVFGSSVGFCQSNNSDPYENSNAVKDEMNRCNLNAAKLHDKISDLDNDYKKHLEEYHEGLFCSKCHHTKSQIEAAGEDFYAHLKRVDGHVVPANQNDYNILYNSYIGERRNAVDAYSNAQQECSGLSSQYNTARNQDYNNLINAQQAEAKSKQDAEKAKQDAEKARQDAARQKAIDEANARYNKVMDDYQRQKDLEKQEGDKLNNSMAATSQATQEKIAAAQSQNTLDNFADQSGQLKNILNSVPDGESSVFAPAMMNNENNGLLTADQQLELDNIKVMASDYLAEGKARITTAFNSLLGNSYSVMEDNNRAIETYSDSYVEAGKIEVVEIAPVFSEIRENYMAAYQANERFKETSELAKPKNTWEYMKSLYNVDTKMSDEMFDDQSDNTFYNNISDINANNAGGIGGQIEQISNPSYSKIFTDSVLEYLRKKMKRSEDDR